ncbi:unnamed protein product [Heligmosomoides polygyrus]|uniref:5-methyltetrahydropteroyltriglutamate--homocysteine methyltransferase n=1 Tax=Heligmosomoides polygyrus TaxID=6339 RepID=A0A183G593_HELPZ|nr:unnamed protein product [Heligmosomoides polygyrus]
MSSTVINTGYVGGRWREALLKRGAAPDSDGFLRKANAAVNQSRNYSFVFQHADVVDFDEVTQVKGNPAHAPRDNFTK